MTAALAYQGMRHFAVLGRSGFLDRLALRGQHRVGVALRTTVVFVELLSFQFMALYLTAVRATPYLIFVRMDLLFEQLILGQVRRLALVVQQHHVMSAFRADIRFAFDPVAQHDMRDVIDEHREREEPCQTAYTESQLICSALHFLH